MEIKEMLTITSSSLCFVSCHSFCFYVTSWLWTNK